MFRSVLRVGINPVQVSSASRVALRQFRTSGVKLVEDDLVRKQLFEAVKANENSTATKIDDSLFDVLNNLDTRPAVNEELQDDFGFGSITETHPRDIAKNIRINGPIAGRTVDIKQGQVGFGLVGIRNVLRNNKIRYLQRVQARHIPKAKFRKQQKREWWRRTFFKGFKQLLAKVSDARRRGY